MSKPALFAMRTISTPGTMRTAIETTTSPRASFSLTGLRAISRAEACLLRDSFCERVRPHLQLVDLRAVRRAALVVEHRARARHGPHALALPPGLRVVDAPVGQLGEEAHGIRHAKIDDLAVDHRHQRLAAVRHGDRDIGAEPKRVVAI